MVNRALVFALAGALWLAGCASYTEETREIRSLYRSDSYKAALEKLEKSGLKEDDKNRLLYRLEKAMILKSLRHHQGNISRVAQALGLSRAALYRRLEKYEIPV